MMDEYSSWCEAPVPKRGLFSARSGAVPASAPERAWRAVCSTAGMDEIGLRTTLEPFATWLQAHTAECADRAAALTGESLRVHPPFQGPGPGGGVVLTFAPVVGGQPLGRGSYHAALAPHAAAPPLVLQIAVVPAPDGLRLQRLTDMPAARALWEALLAAVPPAWREAPPAAPPQGGVIRHP